MFYTNRRSPVKGEPGYRRFCERLGSFARVILFAGSGIELHDRGLAARRGIEGERRLFAVA